MKLNKIILLATLLLSQTAFAVPSIQLKLLLTTGKGKDAGEANTVFSISDLGIHTSSKEGAVNVIYNKTTAAVISNKKKSYTTTEDIANGLGPMAGALAAMMPKFSFKETKETSKIKNWNCQKFLIFQNDKEVGSLCAAKMKDLGFTDAEIKTWKAGIASLATIQQMMGNPIFEIAQKLGTDYEAFTIDLKAKSTLELLGQKKVTEFTNQLLSAERAEVAPSQFAIPKDYKHVSKATEIMGMLK